MSSTSVRCAAVCLQPFPCPWIQHASAKLKGHDLHGSSATCSADHLVQHTVPFARMMRLATGFCGLSVSVILSPSRAVPCKPSSVDRTISVPRVDPPSYAHSKLRMMPPRRHGGHHKSCAAYSRLLISLSRLYAWVNLPAKTTDRHDSGPDSMDAETKHSFYHSAPYSAAGTTMMTFKPINAIHQHLCAFHVYSYVSFSRRNRHLTVSLAKIAPATSRHTTTAHTSHQTSINASSTTRTRLRPSSSASSTLYPRSSSTRYPRTRSASGTRTSTRSRAASCRCRPTSN